MSDPTEETPAEAELLGLLSDAFEGRRPTKPTTAPLSVKEGALWVHSWHNADAELAALVDQDLLAGTRSVGAMRLLSFRFDVYELSLEIRGVSATTSTVSGTMLPAGPTKVTILVGSTSYEVETTAESGSFHWPHVVSGTAIGMVSFDSRQLRFGPFDI